MPSHYLNQWCNILNWILRNKLWNCNRHSYRFIEQNALQNIVCEMTAILSRPQCVNNRLLLLTITLLRKQKIVATMVSSEFGHMHVVCFFFLNEFYLMLVQLKPPAKNVFFPFQLIDYHPFGIFHWTWDCYKVPIGLRTTQSYDDVMTWTHFPHCRALMFSLLLGFISHWKNCRMWCHPRCEILYWTWNCPGVSISYGQRKCFQYISSLFNLMCSDNSMLQYIP